MRGEGHGRQRVRFSVRSLFPAAQRKTALRRLSFLLSLIAGDLPYQFEGLFQTLELFRAFQHAPSRGSLIRRP
jgi:hypothetical protein